MTDADSSHVFMVEDFKKALLPTAYLNNILCKMHVNDIF